ncbi:MAG: SGNH/GDSL hydrolase family protein [Cytophagales bacterium]|nr:SGNH/GDSL hydrolase family protein [Cytophagales bacterium]
MPVVKEKVELKILLGYLILLGGLTLLVSLLLNPSILSFFSIDGKIDSSNVERIYTTRWFFLLVGICLILLPSIIMSLPIRNHPISFSGRTILIITLIWMLILLEWGLRINPRYSTIEVYASSPSYLPSPVSQHRLDIQKQYITTRNSGDTIRILTNGFSTDRFSFQKAQGEIRIFVLGGSHVFDLNAENGKDWTSLAQTMLHGEGYTNVTIINAGVPGWRTFDMIGRVIAELHYYNPDYIILCETYNDLKYFSWAEAGTTPFHNLPKLVRPTHEAVNPFVRLVENFQIYLYLRDAILNLRGKAKPQQDGDYTDNRGEGMKVSTMAVNQFRINIDVFVSACQAAGIKPILATEPRLLTEANIDSVMRLNIFSTSTGLGLPVLLNASQACDSVTSQQANHFNIPFFDLAAVCSGANSSFTDLIHYKRGGGACAAEKLKNDLRSLLNQP